MTTFQITNIHSGAYFGTFEGADAAEAVAAMHRDAGYGVRAEGGKLIFCTEETAKICGDLGEAWQATEVSTPDAEAITKLRQAIDLLHQVRMATIHPTGPGFFDLPKAEPGTEKLGDILGDLRAMERKLSDRLQPVRKKTVEEMFDGMI